MELVTLLMTGNEVFDELFVLEVANNHLGDLQRGLKIINNYAQVVRFNNVRAAIKLQLRDVDSFIHRDFRGRSDIRYIKKTVDTRLQPADYATMVTAMIGNRMNQLSVLRIFGCVSIQRS